METAPAGEDQIVLADDWLYLGLKRYLSGATPPRWKRPMTSTSLAELLDPDKWIASGKNLTDFPWPNGANEREAMKLILCARPMLNTHVERWSKLVMKTLGRRGGENVGDVFVEEYLRELWERTRVARLA
jgi:hypothetical protein